MRKKLQQPAMLPGEPLWGNIETYRERLLRELVR